MQTLIGVHMTDPIAGGHRTDEFERPHAVLKPTLTAPPSMQQARSCLASQSYATGTRCMNALRVHRATSTSSWL
jgi:hypothetical protein